MDHFAELQKLNRALDRLAKREGRNAVTEYCENPSLFAEEKLPDGEFLISRKLPVSRSDETKTHRFDYEKNAWVPKQARSPLTGQFK